MADTGNAVVAEWQGPSGHQLFDGTRLEPGIIVKGVGKDESSDNPYWKVLGDLDTWTGDAHTDATTRHDDPTFGTEEGGGSTGRPLTEEQQKADAKVLPAPKTKATASTPSGGTE